MSINRLPTIEHYWLADDFIGNHAIRDIVIRSRLRDILQNLHFSCNSAANKHSRASKLRLLTDYFSKLFQDQ